jgi:hypothetical protein
MTPFVFSQDGFKTSFEETEERSCKKGRKADRGDPRERFLNRVEQ